MNANPVAKKGPRRSDANQCPVLQVMTSKGKNKVIVGNLPYFADSVASLVNTDGCLHVPVSALGQGTLP